MYYNFVSIDQLLFELSHKNTETWKHRNTETHTDSYFVKMKDIISFFFLLKKATTNKKNVPLDLLGHISYMVSYHI